MWAMLSVAELLDSHGINPDTIRRAAPGLSPAAVRLASTLASATLGQIEVVAMILAGFYDEASIAAFEADLRRPAPRPRARARARRPPVEGEGSLSARGGRTPHRPLGPSK